MSSEKQCKRARTMERQIKAERMQNAKYWHLINNQAPNWWNIFAVRRWIKRLKGVR